MSPEQIKNYTEKIIPSLEYKLSKIKNKQKLLEAYDLYVDCLRVVAKHDFITYNKYLEINEDVKNPKKAFYNHRKEHMGDLFDALNDMEIHDKYDYLMVSMPPRVGKTVCNIRFITFILGRYPQNTQLCISYADSVTKTFYLGVLQILESQEFKDIFPEAKVIAQNAKDENIWLHTVGQYPSISFIPIEAAMTGRGEAHNYIFYDDLVSGIEQAMSPTRMNKLFQLYTDNSLQRKLDGAKEIHIATRWSVNDVIGRIERLFEGDDKVKVIRKPCYNEDGESAFDFFGGFSTAHFKKIQRVMDKISFGAVYECNPIEREGLLYHADELKYFYELPSENPDTIIAVCDSKNLGKDYVASVVIAVYGDDYYVIDVVYNNGLPEVTRPLVANTWYRNRVVRGDIELNNGGNYYAEEVNKLLKELWNGTSIKIFFSGNNKTVKIVTYADFVKKNFIFRDPSTYSPTSEYAKFMQSVLSWSQVGKNEFDDAPDCLAMAAQMVQDLTFSSIKIINRRTLGL